MPEAIMAIFTLATIAIWLVGLITLFRLFFFLGDSRIRHQQTMKALDRITQLLTPYRD